MGNIRTFVLMAVMTALFMGLGAMIGGGTGALIALVVAGGMNVMAFWNSDKAVLSMAGAREVDSRSAPDLVRMVHEMSDRAGLPRPRVYVIETDQPNAFATGRNPDNAAVAATTGLLRALSREEIAAVMAHELAHVKHRDTLTMTITATMAGAISMLANFGMFFGGNDRDRPGGMLGTIILMIVAPLAAGIVQMAISRSREYEADRLGAEICGDAGALASALQKIEAMARGEINVAAERNPAIAHMFIINPLNGKGADNLFSTHPSTANRVAALMKLAPSITPGREAGRGNVRRDPGAASGWAPPPAPKAATPPADLGAGSIPKISRRPRGDDRDNPWS